VVGPRGDDDDIDAARYRLQVVVGPVALDRVGVRVDREDLVPAVTQPLVHDVAAVRRRASEIRR